MSLEVLKECKILEKVSDEYLQFLDAHSNRIDLVSDEYLFHLGDPGSGMYIVISGEISLVMEYKDSKGVHTKELAAVKPGECFGEVTLLGDTPRTASALASTNSELLFIDFETLHSDIDDDNVDALKICLNVAKALTKRLENANKIIVEIEKETGKIETVSEMEAVKKRLLQEFTF